MGIQSVLLGSKTTSARGLGQRGLGLNRPTNAIVEMRRLIAQRSLDRQSIEAAAELRFPEITLKTVIKQVGGAISPRGERLLAENDGDKFAAIAGGAHHDIVASIADEASFHTIRARKADQHPVMGAYDFVAVADTDFFND
jgi:hypothetical protein